MDELNGRYGFEDEGVKNFAMAKYMSFQMCEEKLFLAKLNIFKN